MQVSVETTQGLERRLTITVPAATVDAAVRKELNGLAKTRRIDGFRPGKAPVAIIKKMFGAMAHARVADECVVDSLDTILSRNDRKSIAVGENTLRTNAHATSNFITRSLCGVKIGRENFANPVVIKANAFIGDDQIRADVVWQSKGERNFRLSRF